MAESWLAEASSTVEVASSTAERLVEVADELPDASQPSGISREPPASSIMFDGQRPV